MEKIARPLVIARYRRLHAPENLDKRRSFAVPGGGMPKLEGVYDLCIQIERLAPPPQEP